MGSMQPNNRTHEPLRRKETGRLLFICLLTITLFGLVDLAYSALRRAHEPGVRDPVFHHTFRPYFAGPRVWGSSRYMFFTDSLGFADRAPRAVPLKTSAHRILFLGDSFTEGMGVPYDRTFAGVFSSALEGRNVEVLNAAVASYSPRLYYLKLKYLLDQGLNIDELFVFIDISDIQDEAFFARNGIVWGEVDPEAVDPRTLNLGTRFFPARRWASEHLMLTTIAYRAIGTLLRRRGGHRVGSDDLVETFDLNPATPTWLRVRGAWTFDRTLFDDWGRDGLALCRIYMEKVVALCEEHKIKLRVAVYPWPYQILAKEVNSPQVAYWSEFCSSRGIPFLNFFPYFEGESQPETAVRKFFISGDIHLNPEGHQKFAAVLTDFWRAMQQ